MAKESFLAFVLKTSLKSGASLLLQRNFVLISVLGICLQYYISPHPQERMGPWTVVVKGTFSLLLSFFGYLLIKYRRLLFCVIATLPRDLRGAYRFYSVIRRIRWAEKNWMTVPKVFDKYADKNPRKVCFYYEDEKWTYKEVQDLSNQIGNYFAQKGFIRGDTVALFMENRPEYVCIWMGLNKIGVCAALVNYNLRLQPLLHCFEIVKAKAVIYGNELSPAVQELLEMENMLSTIPIYCSGRKDSMMPRGVFDLDSELLETSTETPRALRDMKLNDSLYYIYTSGTTGLPKAAVIKSYRFFMAAFGVHHMNQVREDDILYDSLPLYHMTGGMVGVGQALLFGTSVVIRKRFSASQFFKDCIKYDVTVAQYLGETCRYLLAQPPTPEEKLHKIRLFSGNGLRQEIWQQVVDRFNIKEIGEVYGSTEGNCNVSNIDSKVGAVGFVPRLLYPFLPMCLARINEKTGELVRDPETGLVVRCRPNEPGELVGKIIKQHPIRDFQGYTDEESTKKKVARSVFKPGDFTFRTGDILVMDEFGYLYFKDRTGDTYRWKGENVSTTEVEAVISSTCSFKDAVVYGVKIPNTEGRAGMVAIADASGTLDLEHLSTALTKSLPAYARPLFLRVLDKMDMTGTYKMRKVRFQDEGYEIEKIKDAVYFFQGGKFVPLQPDLYDQINSGKVRL